MNEDDKRAFNNDIARRPQLNEQKRQLSRNLRDFDNSLGSSTVNSYQHDEEPSSPGYVGNPNNYQR